jgi:hypothetical protein
LTATGDRYAPGSDLESNGKRYLAEATGTAAGEAAGPSGSSGRRAVTYTVFRGAENPLERAVVLDWGDEQLVLTGSEVHPDDVAIYGRTSTGRS